MEDFNKIIEKYNNFSKCLIRIKDNLNNFKNISHPFIFSFLIGYFSIDNKLDIKDMKHIYIEYQNGIFDQKNDFFTDFKEIAFIFCNYFEKKIKNSTNIINNNIINSDTNIFNSNYNIGKEIYNFYNQNQNQNITNNNINKKGLNNNNNKNNIIDSNNNNLNNSNKNIIYQNSNDNESSNDFNIINQNSNNSIKNQNDNFDINTIDDYQLAQQLAEEEKLMFQRRQDEDASMQNKKCEICLEEFSLLDGTNYFLNCNCVLHNKCFDEMVKSAVENNTLPIKCPNCKIPIHPNFIEDSIRNANPQLLPKYDKFSMNNFIQNNSDEYSSCPTPGCEYMFFFNPGEFNFYCPLCTKHYCLNCKDEWHVNMTCQEYKDSRDVNKLDDKFFQFVKGAKFKMCPRCKYWVEKNQGCNHMKCRCGADFCYLCGKFMDMRRGHKC